MPMQPRRYDRSFGMRKNGEGAEVIYTGEKKKERQQGTEEWTREETRREKKRSGELSSRLSLDKRRQIINNVFDIYARARARARVCVGDLLLSTNFGSDSFSNLPCRIGSLSEYRSPGIPRPRPKRASRLLYIRFRNVQHDRIRNRGSKLEERMRSLVCTQS